MEDILVPLAMFATIGIGLWAYFSFKYRTRNDVHVTIRQALEHGQQLSPEVIRGLANVPDPSTRDLRRGAMGVGLGVALLIAAQFISDSDAQEGLSVVAAFPITLGVVFLLLWKFMPRQAA